MLFSGQRSLDYDLLVQRSQKAAAGFHSLGIGREDTVAIMMRNDFPFIEAMMGVGQLGGYAVPINWHYTADETRYLLDDCKAKVLLVHEDLLPGIQAGIPEGVRVLTAPTPPEIRQGYKITERRSAPPKTGSDWDEWLARFNPMAPVEMEPPSAMIYTSGTTGRPKGVRRVQPTAEQAVAMRENIGLAWGLTQGLRDPGAQEIATIIPAPLYHSAPNGYSMMCVRAKADIVLMPRFDAEEFLRLVQTHRITHVQMVPTMFSRLLKLPDDVRLKYDLSSLRHIIHAAAPCPPQVKRAMIEWLGPIIYEYYGSTETSAVLYCNSEEWLDHPGTVGKPLPNVDCRILDEAGNDVAPGVPGDLYICNQAINDFTYHGAEEKRRSVERDNLICVGDIAYRDEDGFVYLCDRRNDMVISGGVNIYPAEIEGELLNVAGVADGAVFGIPDEDLGEVLCAVIQPAVGADLDAAEVRRALLQSLAGYKIPKVIEFRSELPREDSGKLFKRKLREPYWEKANRKI